MPPKPGNCVDCGKRTWSARHAQRCKRCAKVGELNPQWGIFNSAKADQGRDRARRRFRFLGQCERCKAAPAIERHHRNGDTHDNAPENIQCVCRRCHMIIDGRITRMGEIGAKGNKSRHL